MWFSEGKGACGYDFLCKTLIEKTLEHEETVYITFVNLKKAYDSVPCEALWKALEKYGYPPNMIRLIRSFHDGLKINGELLEEEISVINGLHNDTNSF